MLQEAPKANPDPVNEVRLPDPQEHQIYVEERDDEIVYYFPYSDSESSSGVSSIEFLPTDDIQEQLNKIREKCLDLQVLLRRERQEQQNHLFTCLEKIQAQIDSSGRDIRNMMGISIFSREVSKVNEKEEKGKCIGVLNDVRCYTQFHLDNLSIAVARIFNETFFESNETQRPHEVIQDLIESLDKEQEVGKERLLDVNQQQVQEKFHFVLCEL